MRTSRSGTAAHDSQPSAQQNYVALSPPAHDPARAKRTESPLPGDGFRPGLRAVPQAVERFDDPQPRSRRPNPDGSGSWRNAPTEEIGDLARRPRPEGLRLAITDTSATVPVGPCSRQCIRLARYLSSPQRRRSQTFAATRARDHQASAPLTTTRAFLLSPIKLRRRMRGIGHRRHARQNRRYRAHTRRGLATQINL